MNLLPAKSDPTNNGEHRLIWKQNTQNDENNTQETEQDASIKQQEAKRNAEKASEDTIEGLTTKQKKEILKNVPSTLLSKYTLGAFYLTDTLLSLLPEREVQTLAEQKGNIDLTKIETIETILAGTFRKGADNIQIANQLKKLLERKLEQYEELRAAAEKRYAKMRGINVDRIDQLEQKLRLNGTTIDSWLRTASTSEICNELQMQKMPDSQRDVLIQKIRDYLDTRRRLENWSMPTIDRNAQLRQMLEEGRSIPDIQKDICNQTREVLPLLAEIVHEQIHEEAAKTRQWLDAERKKYEKDFPVVTLQNHEEVENSIETFFLKTHGISARALAREIERAEGTIAFAEDVAGDNGVKHIVDAAALCDHLHDLREVPGNGKSRAIIAGPANEQQAAEVWAEEMRNGLDVVYTKYPTDKEKDPIEETFGTKGLFEDLAKIREDLTPSDTNPRGVNAYNYPSSRRQRLLMLVRSLGQQRIVDAIRMHRELTAHEEQDSKDLIVDLVEKTRNQLNTTVGQIVDLPILQKGISAIIGIPKHVESRGIMLDETLTHILQKGGESHAKVADVSVEIGKLDTAAEMIENLENNMNVVELTTKQFKKRTGADMYAAYNYATTEILINKERCDKEGVDIAEQIEHEKGHAIQDIFTRRTGAFPFLHRTAYEVLAESDAGFSMQLVEQAKAWGLADQLKQIRERAINEEEAQAILQELLTEELLNRYADYLEGRLKQPTPQEQALFNTIKSTQLIELMQGRELIQRDGITRGDIKPITLFQSGDNDVIEEEDIQDTTNATGGFATNVSAEEGESEGGETTDTVSIKGKLQKCNDLINQLQEFNDATPNLQGDLGSALPMYRSNYDTLMEVFQTQRWDGKPYENPEEQKEYQNLVTDFLKDLEKVEEEMNKISAQLRDLSDEPPTGESGFVKIFGGIHFMSALDFYLMFKDTVEDIKRMWERRSKQERAAVAQGLFHWIPENEIPGLRYFGRLTKENEKREQQAEDEEVDIWKEGLKNKDAYQLIEIMSKISHNKDQVKAILYLLSEKGRIDWGDERIWEVLNRHSIYHMPKKQCERDILLRNSWLNKLVCDIWDDKDLFLEWKTTTDSNFTSGRDKFNNSVDSLSQRTGAMGGELERILKVYTECTKTGETPPQDVNPHMYEKILEFAMMKGKMTMEGKFYYLIQGVAAGLLPLERINILNNQVLMTFPFIDYFANQHNSLPDIQRIAKQLKENDTSFKPGIKTTLFLELELARDEKTRSRVIKMITRAGESMDHEDVPMLMAFLDHGGVNEMMSAFSGARQRMTVEGVKNAYVGYNTLFKTYARTAELEEEGVTRFTKKDALHLGRSMLAYVHFDNIVLQAANDGKARQSVTKEQIEDEQMPSGSGMTPSQFRNPMGALTKEMFEKYGITGVEVGKDKDGNPVMVSINDYLGAIRGYRVISDKEERQRLFDATIIFQRELLAAIEKNHTIFTDVLKAHTGKNGLIEEGTEKGKEEEGMTKKNVREAIRAKAK